MRTQSSPCRQSSSSSKMQHQCRETPQSPPPKGRAERVCRASACGLSGSWAAAARAPSGSDGAAINRRRRLDGGGVGGRRRPCDEPAAGPGRPGPKTAAAARLEASANVGVGMSGGVRQLRGTRGGGVSPAPLHRGAPCSAAEVEADFAKRAASAAASASSGQVLQGWPGVRAGASDASDAGCAPAEPGAMSRSMDTSGVSAPSRATRIVGGVPAQRPADGASPEPSDAEVSEPPSARSTGDGAGAGSGGCAHDAGSGGGGGPDSGADSGGCESSVGFAGGWAALRISPKALRNSPTECFSAWGSTPSAAAETSGAVQGEARGARGRTAVLSPKRCSWRPPGAARRPARAASQAAAADLLAANRRWSGLPGREAGGT